MQKLSRQTFKLSTQTVSLPSSFPVECVCDYHLSDHEARTTLHIHNHLELGYCHGGSGVFVVGGKLMPFGGGDTVVVNDREMHRAQSRRGTESIWSWVWVDVPALLLPFCTDSSLFDSSGLCGESFSNVLSPQVHPAPCWATSELVRELRHKGSVDQTTVRALVVFLMSHLRRMLPAGPPKTPVAGDMKHKERLAPALNHISTHYAQALRLEDLAGMCYVSVPHFRRLFAATIGMNPLEYILRLRITMACIELKATGETAERVAFDNGFPTFSCFLRKFRQIVGTTPHLYRSGRG